MPRAPARLSLRKFQLLVAATVLALSSAGGAGIRATVRAPAGRIVRELGYANGNGLVGWLEIADLSGANRRLLTRPPPRGTGRTDVATTWSPDGSHVAFIRTIFKRDHYLDNEVYSAAVKSSAVYVADADGTKLRAVVSLRNVVTNEIAWSPDGTRLAVISMREAATKRANRRLLVVASELDVVNVARRTRRVLLAAAAREDLEDAKWSPDGSSIAVERQSRRLVSSCGFSLEPAIYVVPADGSHARRLATLPPPARPRAQHPGIWTDDGWSPDGTTLLYVQSRFTNGECRYGFETASRIYRVPTNGSPVRLLGEFPPVGSAAWSLDGATIAFKSGCEDWCDLFVIDSMGTRARQLTARSAAGLSDEEIDSVRDVDFRWMSNGSEIVYTDAYVINAVSADTGGKRNIAANDQPASELLAVSRDGARLAYHTFGGAGDGVLVVTDIETTATWRVSDPDSRRDAFVRARAVFLP